MLIKALPYKTCTCQHSQHVEVIRNPEQNETQVALSAKFNVGQALISRIKCDKEKILDQ